MMSIQSAFASICCFIVLCCLTGCGLQTQVSGQVIDEQTKMPVEGAAVGIRWIHYKMGPPGLPMPTEELGTTETITDAKGLFTIPKHSGSGRSYHMGVYKKGYICWNSDTIFNPSGKTNEEMYPKRTDHHVDNGMVVQLQPLTSDIPLDKHALFTATTETRLSPTGLGPFTQAIEHELKRVRKIMKERRK